MNLQDLAVKHSILLKGRIKEKDGCFYFKYRGRKLVFLNAFGFEAYPLNEIFINEVYKKLNVKGKNVIDIGASIGDSAIYFALNGAKYVYGYEINPKREYYSGINLKINRDCYPYIKEIEKIKIVCKEYDGYLPKDAVFKIDCDGCEYSLINKHIDKLKRAKEIIIEYHNGYIEIKKKFEDIGFDVKILNNKNKIGILYATK